MLTHIVCWKYKPETSDESRAAHIAALRTLPGMIAEVIDFEVGADILRLERSYDTGLTSTFADREALDIYTNHPEHQRVVAMGREIAERVVSVDFLSEPVA